MKEENAEIRQRIKKGFMLLLKWRVVMPHTEPQIQAGLGQSFLCLALTSTLP